MTFAHLMRRPGGVALLLCGAGLLTGCGGGEPVATVSGTITLAGKSPGEGLAISFVGASGQPVGALVGADGKYRVENVPVGEVQVGFSHALTSQAEKDGGGRPDPGAKPARPKPVKENLPLPKRYTDPRESGLTFKVKPGEENTFNYDIPKQ